MGIYSPVGTGMFASPHQSSERLVLFTLLRWYERIALLILAAIMFLVIWPVIRAPGAYDQWLLLLAFPVIVVAYVCFIVVANQARSLLQIAHDATRGYRPLHRLVHRAIRLRYRLHKARTVRRLPSFIGRGVQATILIVFVVAFMAVTRQAYVYRGLPIDEGSLWLLYVLPIQHVARAGSMRLLAAVCAMIVVSVFVVSRLFNVPLLFDADRLLLLKAFWLLLICLVPMLLMIYFRDREAGFLKMRLLANQLASIHMTLDHGLANAIASTIADDLGYPYVNIFVVKTSPTTNRIEGLRLIGAANEAGRKLVDEGFVLDGPNGITGFAALQRSYCLVNDVRRDTRKRFISHPAFAGTRSEFALPILLGETMLGVLDIQSTHAYVFSQDDVQLLEALTTHLAMVFSSAQNLLRVTGLYAASQTATRRLVTYHEASLALREICKSARNVLQADSVVLYTRDPFSGQIDGPYTAGIDDSMASPGRVVQTNKRSRVHQILRSRDVRFFEKSDHQDYRAQGSRFRNGPFFFERMAIQSTVAIPISGSDEHPESQLGVIFVNYRSQRSRGTFTDDDIEWCESLADIASLVLQNAALFQQVILEERISMGRDIHDGLGQYASFTRMLLEQAMSEYDAHGTLTDAEHKKLLYARQVSQLLQQEVNSLLNLWYKPSGGSSLFEWAHAYAELLGRIKMECTLTTSGDDSVIPVEMKHDVEVIIREAIRNADRHGEAHKACIELRIDQRALVLRIVDDGVGFNWDGVRASGGLANIEYRAKRWGGKMHVRSRTQGVNGTYLFVRFQLDRLGDAPLRTRRHALLDGVTQSSRNF